MILDDVILPLYDELKDLILDPSVLNYPVEVKKDSNMVFLDLAPLKQRGGVKAVGSVSAKTGAIVKIVAIAKLASFEPIMDEIQKV